MHHNSVPCSRYGAGVGAVRAAPSAQCIRLWGCSGDLRYPNKELQRAYMAGRLHGTKHSRAALATWGVPVTRVSMHGGLRE